MLDIDLKTPFEMLCKLSGWHARTKLDIENKNNWKYTCYLK